MSERIFDAIDYAARQHRGQHRKGTTIPYIVHPVAVVERLAAWGCPEDVVIAGALHDVVEDTGASLDDIEARFGAGVRALVAACTEPDKALPWEQRKAHTISALGTAPLGALMVTCADKLDNLRTIREGLAVEGEATWRRFKRGRDDQRWYYRSVADVVRERAGAAPWARAFLEAVEQVFPTS